MRGSGGSAGSTRGAGMTVSICAGGTGGTAVQAERSTSKMTAEERSMARQD
jgi:hypothetical protein